MAESYFGGHFVLGLDIGVASVGWSVIGSDKKGVPASVICAGAHMFDAGVEGDVERIGHALPAAPI